MIKFEKTCSICGNTFPATKEYFHVHAIKMYRGLRPECKECRKKIRHEDYLKKKEKNTDYIITGNGQVHMPSDKLNKYKIVRDTAKELLEVNK